MLVMDASNTGTTITIITSTFGRNCPAATNPINIYTNPRL